MNKKVVGVAVCCAVLAAVVGCSVSKRTLDGTERRINVLKSKGVPDSSLSRAVVFLYQAREAKKRGEGHLARTSADTMLYLVAAAEADFQGKLQTVKTTVDSLRSIVDVTRRELTGLQLRELDSLVAKSDSFATINWVLQTEDYMRKAVAALPALKFCQARAEELRPRVPGVWTCVDVKKSDAHPEVNMPEQKIFDLGRDGKATFTEKGAGRAGTHLKLNYEFISNGTYDLKGDTILMFVERFRRVREESEERFDADGKQTWKASSQPPFDSVITDGSQDRFITFSDLQTDFKQTKKY